MTKVFDATKFRKSITKSIQGLGIGFSDPTDWISTGNYALNYLMTSDFNKGIPLGKVTVLAGESGAGKSYIDLCDDQLQSDYNAIKNNHYIGADIFIALANNENIFKPNFIDWCKDNNINAYEKKNGIGLLPIGKVENINIEHLTKDSKANIIVERN